MDILVFAFVSAEAWEYCIRRLIFIQIGIAVWTSLYLSTRAYGLGLHIEYVPVEDISQFLYVSQIIFSGPHRLNVSSCVI